MNSEYQYGLSDCAVPPGYLAPHRANSGSPCSPQVHVQLMPFYLSLNTPPHLALLPLLPLHSPPLHLHSLAHHLARLPGCQGCSAGGHIDVPNAAMCIRQCIMQAPHAWTADGAGLMRDWPSREHHASSDGQSGSQGFPNSREGLTRHS